ncbi:MAG: hypothetical protein ACYDH6_23100 [Acidimicrobiales bacterium]
MMPTEPTTKQEPERRANWFEDPHISLERLTPGQRYTAAIVIVLSLLMLGIGLPRHTTSPTNGPVPVTGTVGRAPTIVTTP